ncbi:uncharacterized protein [Physcomitrium patens]|uniref:Uncharacterized protein n=1 Tax=Physcomitrium patens TaxID=3218 RepID=A0A2K1II38_PHYPA|nr:uncharacterized protein LOC112276255 [Physcomitrium patens]XP_024363165.1 uncharacterized protein LOC112276255 [Physcomitrium patens]XP_024363166.1 uncharacterized protein LOC112276255 [Physcomitrium patens]XP_024363167.1 uncharacterized protein LOC112276255 [Physcomitrium patens]XP_024363168.1 uncharacterized protein LOC112276255 [Physcomitrium patens]XP_024363169.1 uncharacterized protein LOC112276255 [Physcomitrium patens]PNR28938.1 hypothetical protein PHYPA_027630 [Physcomitrium paten|eukprot:XP_024363164.1 uncharacterized protein LOC112276255 [Physcomitrella patens]
MLEALRTFEELNSLTAQKMETLATLARLSISPRRNRSSNKFSDDEVSTTSTPYFLSAPTSPRRASLREIEETPLGEVHCAVPFEWELRPGTPKRSRGSRNNDGSSEMDVEERELGSRSRSSSPERLSRQSSTSDFDFSSARFIPPEETHALNDSSIASADELFFHGQLLPLTLPPRLQAVKQLKDSTDSSPGSDGGVLQGSFRKPRSGSSPLKLLSLRGRSKSPQRGALHSTAWPILGLEPEQENGICQRLQKFRSLSPLKIFKRESPEVNAMFSDKSTDSASSSTSSAFSSSSSSGDENFINVGISKEFWPFFEESKQRRGSKTLHDFLYSEKLPSSPKIDVSKLSSKEVLRKAERFNAAPGAEAGLNSAAQVVHSKRELDKSGSVERKALTPQLSRSNARSMSRTPIMPSQAQPLPQRSQSRPDFRSNPKRSFGILKRCLRIAPPAFPRSP